MTRRRITLALTLAAGLGARSAFAHGNDADTKTPTPSQRPIAESPLDGGKLSLRGPVLPAPDLPTGQNRSGVSSQAISLPQGSAHVQGMGESFSAQLATGIATFQVPIALPAGRGGVRPSLVLSYSSARGHGVAGLGWDISVPFISRQTDRGVPRYADPAPGSDWIPTQDRFVFNGGRELVPICLVGASGECDGALANEAMPAWSTKWQYFRSRVEEEFVRFFWSPDHRTWRVQSKDGTVLELGVPLDGTNEDGALEVDPVSNGRIFRWNLAREFDARGGIDAPVNVAAFRYASAEGQAYLTDVFDTPPRVNAAAAPVAEYAHHTHLAYETRTDPATSYRRGWGTRQTLRVLRIDVTSKTFDGSPADARELVRRYHFSYDALYHPSLLSSLQLEGRCAAPVVEDDTSALPDVSGCPRLPAMTFEYQHVAPFTLDGQAASADLPGFEGFDERLVPMKKSPPYSLDGVDTDLFDVNSDGLPDVLVTLPALFGGKHGVFFQGSGGETDTFSPSTIGVAGVLGDDAGTLRLSNLNVSPQDADGDGRTDLVHMPKLKQYGVYAPALLGVGWTWVGRAIATASAQNTKIDFQNGADRTRVMDVDGDGLVDVVFSSATEIQTFFSLGRYPGGDGQFGHAQWTGASTADVSNDPVTSCVPWSASGVSFSDPDVRIADLNGDGLPDIVRLRKGDVRYWPGRGNGFWGTGDPASCPGGTFGQNQHVAMAQSPLFSDVDELPRLDDVNGDGFDDLVQVRFDAVDIWLNVDGEGWSADRHVIYKTPPNGPVTNHVRLADVDGSGTRDILWGDANAYKYIDLSGGVRPWVLTRIANGMGKTTDVEYTSSAQLMLDAAKAQAAWATTMPAIAHVVRKVTERDHLDVIGRPEGVYVTEYDYTDPAYDGRQREFRGFRRATTRRVGDANGPSSSVVSSMLTGDCVDEDPLDAIDPCAPPDRWRDNVSEALKGKTFQQVTLDEAGTTLSTAHATWTLRRLYMGLDGREVRDAVPSQADTFLYDTSPFVPAADAVALPSIVREVGPGPASVEMSTLALASKVGRAHLRRATQLDPFGNVLTLKDEGCVDGCVEVDESITKTFVPSRFGGDTSGWGWRTSEEFVEGSGHLGKRLHRFFSFDAYGDLAGTAAELIGTLGLDRHHEDPAATVAPPPSAASADGILQLSALTRDELGNVTAIHGSGGHCSMLEYDTAYAALPVVETLLVGTVVGECGTTPLTSSGIYDRGLGIVVGAFDVHGELTVVEHDGFGRPAKIFRPSPDIVGVTSPIPSLTIDYVVPSDSAATPYSTVHVRSQDGTDDTVDSYRDTWTYVDGLGRDLLVLDQADPAQGDAAPWIASGYVTYDAKGEVDRSYLPVFLSADPAQPPLGAPPASTFRRQRYDAFGRVLETFDLDGTKVSKVRQHAVSLDAFDAEDLQPGPHLGTPSTERRDGHGRVVASGETIHVGNVVEHREMRTEYLPTGEPERLTRVRLGAPDPAVVRWLRYDSLGRMVLNVEPDASVGFTADLAADPATFKAWRYAWSDAGDLVGTSDARGCGVNFAYDGGGRLFAEDYSPCKIGQPAYSPPDLLTGYGLEVLHRYDALDAGGPTAAEFPVLASVYAGRLVSTSDRGAKTVFRYDGRGRTTGVARRLARPGDPDPDPALRYAPHWFVTETTLDGSDRRLTQTTGADAAELQGANASSVVATSYTKRGAIAEVGGSYGKLVGITQRDADGLVRELTFGDLAETTRHFEYDTRRRVASVQTYRAAPGAWSLPPPDYLPAPVPSEPTLPLLLEDTDFTYDEVGNPVAIYDHRSQAEWPAGAKPVDRFITYDDLYRVAKVDYVHQGGPDGWTSPFAYEDAGGSDPRRGAPAPRVAFSGRVRSESFVYDWLGNTTSTVDDATGFFDRSLGVVTNGTPSAGPYQIAAASNESPPPADATRVGHLTVAYDEAGDISSLAVVRSGPCLPVSSTCSHRFAYDWDEAGRLVRARRWDSALVGGATDPLPVTSPSAEVSYSYDSGDERVRKSTAYANGDRHSLYVFPSLELRGATWSGDDYVRTADVEVAYLDASGERLARVEVDPASPTLGVSGSLHVLLEVPDYLGSASRAIDKTTSELVEAVTYTVYGQVDSDLRTSRWGGFREDYRFTGKEDDVELGVTYFGRRFYSPALGRWLSADPLAMHGLDADANVYAYVHGRALQTWDPLGLRDPAELETTGDSTVLWKNGQKGGVVADDPEVMDPAYAVKAFAEDTLAATGAEPVQSSAKEALKREADKMVVQAATLLIGGVAGPLAVGGALLGKRASDHTLAFLNAKNPAQRGTAAGHLGLDLVEMAIMFTPVAAESEATVAGDGATVGVEFNPVEARAGGEGPVAARVETSTAADVPTTAAPPQATRKISGVPGADFKPSPDVTRPYARPSGAGPTRAQKASVQGKPCVGCGKVTKRQVADHIDPLVVEHYRTGSVDVAQQSSVGAVQPHCPHCSAEQGGHLGAFGRKMKKDLGF